MITVEFTQEEFVLVKKGLAKLTKSRNDSLKNSIKYDRQNIVSKRETEIVEINSFLNRLDSVQILEHAVS